jgi:hypothetical protein
LPTGVDRPRRDGRSISKIDPVTKAELRLVPASLTCSDENYLEEGDEGPDWLDRFLRAIS